MEGERQKQYRPNLSGEDAVDEHIAGGDDQHNQFFSCRNGKGRGAESGKTFNHGAKLRKSRSQRRCKDSDNILNLQGKTGKTKLLANQLVADSPYVDYSDARVTGEFAAQLGDEHVEAAGVEIAVVAP